MSRVYARDVREATLKAAIALLERSGCNVRYERPAYDRAILHIEIPPDSADKHGDALRAAIAEQEANAAST